MYLSYNQTFSQFVSSTIKGRRKNVEINFIDINRLDLSYYYVDFFGGPNENFNYLTNDENINI